MFRDQPAIAVSIIATFVFGAVASFVPLDWAWGLNHVQFLPSWFTWLYLIVALMAITVILLPIKATALDSMVEAIDRTLWGESRWPAVFVALAFIPVFYLLRVETHLLGDGYAWLGNFGSGVGYIHKWSEYGSIFVIRGTQFLMGEYNQDTALATFQILSISSGVIVVYSFIGIVGRLCIRPSGRILGLSTLILSGALLLFFGYVEFYAMSWAASSVFILLAIKYIKNSGKLLLAIVVFVLSYLIHVQAVFFLVGLAFLIIHKVQSVEVRKVLYLSLVFAVVGGIVLLVWLVRTRVEVEVLFLPLFGGRPSAPDYFLFSLPHLKDLSQQLFLICPGALILIALWLKQKPIIVWDDTSRFLGLLSAGSITFLIVFGAALTRARDWDVMSLSLFAPVLFVLYQICGRDSSLKNRTAVSYSLVCFVFATAFVMSAINAKPSEERYYSLLSYPQSKDYRGWVIYNNYLQEAGRTEEADHLKGEIESLFPDQILLNRANELIQSGDASGTLGLALRIADEDPYNVGALALVGQAYANNRQFDKAEQYLDRALRLSPYFPTILNGMAQVYIGQQRFGEALQMTRRAYAADPDNLEYLAVLGATHLYNRNFDSTRAIARTLLDQDTCNPRGNRLMIMLSLVQQNEDTARHYYYKFGDCGKLSPSYEAVIREYQFLYND